jgi:hypothetical protein
MKRLYLVAKPSHVEVDVDGLTYPTPAYDSLLPGEGTWPICQALSCLVTAVGGGTFWGM